MRTGFVPGSRLPHVSCCWTTPLGILVLFLDLMLILPISVHSLYNMGNSVCVSLSQGSLRRVSTSRVVRRMGSVERGGRAQRYHRQEHTFLAFSLRKYYFHLTSDNIVRQADTFPVRKCKAIKIAVKNIRSRLSRNACQWQTGATLHAWVEWVGIQTLLWKISCMGEHF